MPVNAASYGALVDLLESIEHFLRRLDIYTQIPHTPTLDEMVVKKKDVEAVLQRLDRLTQDEARTTAAEILKIVYGLFCNMNVVMDGEQRAQLFTHRPLSILLFRR